MNDLVAGGGPNAVLFSQLLKGERVCQPMYGDGPSLLRSNGDSIGCGLVGERNPHFLHQVVGECGVIHTEGSHIFAVQVVVSLSRVGTRLSSAVPKPLNFPLPKPLPVLLRAVNGPPPPLPSNRSTIERFCPIISSLHPEKTGEKDFIKYKQDVSPSRASSANRSVLLRKPVRAKRPVCI